MINLFDVKDKVVIITGGLGQLGSQFSLALAERGAKVAVFDIRKNEVWEQLLIEGFPPSISQNLLILSVDVTKRESVERGLNKIIEGWCTPHALINVAAIDNSDSWDKVMEVNVKGTYLCCEIIGKAMERIIPHCYCNSIINIGSTYGMVSPDQRIYKDFMKPVAYCASKSAILNLTRYYSTLYKYVRVNTLTLGGVFNNQDEQFVKNYCQRVPMGRMALKDEYNGAVIFLISEASSYMTGSNLVIDGGWTAW